MLHGFISVPRPVVVVVVALLSCNGDDSPDSPDSPDSRLVGRYIEVAQLPCGGGADIEPMPDIGELAFEANGEFSVTWFPIHSHIDYRGTYDHDIQTGALVLKVDGGSYVPPDIDGEGSFSFATGQLVLQDIWLGSASDFMGEPACGHRFE